MFKNSLPVFAAGAIFAIAAAGGGVAAFAVTNTPKTGAFDASGVALDTDGNGLTDVIAARLRCPKGTQMTGGGGGDGTSTGYPLFSAPDANEHWFFAVGVDENTSENPANVWASVVCWSKDGSHLGGSYRTAATRPVSEPIPAADVRLVKRAVANRG